MLSRFGCTGKLILLEHGSKRMYIFKHACMHFSACVLSPGAFRNYLGLLKLRCYSALSLFNTCRSSCTDCDAHMHPACMHACIKQYKVHTYAYKACVGQRVHTKHCPPTCQIFSACLSVCPCTLCSVGPMSACSKSIRIDLISCMQAACTEKNRFKKEGEKDKQAGQMERQEQSGDIQLDEQFQAFTLRLLEEGRGWGTIYQSVCIYVCICVCMYA